MCERLRVWGNTCAQERGVGGVNGWAAFLSLVRVTQAGGDGSGVQGAQNMGALPELQRAVAQGHSIL